MNGKGDKPRNCFSKKFKDNYDLINWNKPTMPTPNKNEKRSEYVSRCVKQLIGEGKDQEQAIAVCYSMWDDYKEKGKASIEIDGDEIIVE